MSDYPAGSWLRSQAKVAIAPLQSTSGIQNKVLEAAAMGLAQVVTPAALAGIGTELPCRVATSPGAMVQAARELVDDDAVRVDLADRARRYVGQHYSVDAWVPLLERLIERTARVG